VGRVPGVAKTCFLFVLGLHRPISAVATTALMRVEGEERDAQRVYVTFLGKLFTRL